MKSYGNFKYKSRIKRWEFDMENSNIKGHWSGSFKEKMDIRKLILQKM